MMHTLPFVLIALAVGYKVFADASREKQGAVRLLGLIVGTVILVISTLGIVCSAKRCMMANCKTGGMMCPMKSGHMPQAPSNTP